MKSQSHLALDIVMTDDGLDGHIFTLQPTIYHDEDDKSSYEAFPMDAAVTSSDLDELVIETIRLVSAGTFGSYTLRDVGVIYDIIDGDMAMFSWERAAIAVHNLELAGE